MSHTIEIRIGEWNLTTKVEYFWNSGMELAIIAYTEDKEKILAGGILENVGRFSTPVEIILNDVEVYTYKKIHVTVRKVIEHYVIDFIDAGDR